MINSSKKYSKISVKALFRCGNKILYYKTKKGVRDLPGGHVKFGETLMEALKRELAEELGFRFTKDPPLVHAWTYLSSDGKRHSVYLGFLFDLLKQKKIVSREYGNNIEFFWLDRNSIQKQNFPVGMETALLKAASHP